MRRLLLIILILQSQISEIDKVADDQLKELARGYLLQGYSQLLNDNLNEAIISFSESRRIFINMDSSEASIYADMYLLDCYRRQLRFKTFERQYDSIISGYEIPIINIHYNRLLYSKTTALFNQEQYSMALLSCKKLEDNIASDSSMEGFYLKEVLGIKAQCLFMIGKFVESRNCYMKSINGIDINSQNDSLSVAVQLINLSKLYSDNALYDSSSYFLDLALKYCNPEAGMNHKKIADIFIMKGIISNRTGKPEEAKYYFRKAEFLFIEDSISRLKQSAVLYHNKANSYYLLNNFDSSILYVSKAIQLSKYLDFNLIKEHFYFLANLYLEKGDLDSSNHYFRLSLSLYQNDTMIDNHELETLIDYGDFLINHYDSTRGVQLLDSIHPDQGIANFPYSIGLKYYLLRGGYAYRHKQYDLALEYFKGGLGIVEASSTFKHGFQLPTPQTIDFYNQISFTLGELSISKGDTAYANTAKKYTEKLISLIFQLQLTSNDFKGKIFLAEKYEKLLDEQTIMWGQINQSINNKYKMIVSSLLNFKKFIITQGLAIEHDAKESSVIPDNLIRLERELKSRLAAYYLDLHRPGKEILGKETINELQYAKLAIRYDSLIGVFENEYPDYYESKYATPDCKSDAVAARLDDNQIFLDYSIIYDSLIILQILDSKTHDIQMIRIDSSLIHHKDAVLTFMNRSSIRNCPQYVFENYLEGAFQVYQRLVGNYIEIPDETHLIISPPGGLFRIPFEVLITEEKPGITDFKSPEYLIKKSKISYTYSISSFIHSRAIHMINEDARIISVCTGRNSNNASDWLVFDSFESDEASKLFHGEVFDISETTLDSLESLNADYNILHFAAHSAISEDPMLSNVYETEDSTTGIFYTIDIMTRHLDYDLLILSACNSGSGPMLRGEGNFSTAKAFYIAGCKTQLVTLNPVEDHISAQIISSYLRYLKDGYTNSHSLRKAKLDFLAQATPETSHPYYWSSFVFVGDSYYNSSKAWREWLWFGVIILLAFGLISYSFMRKKQKSR